MPNTENVSNVQSWVRKCLIILTRFLMRGLTLTHIRTKSPKDFRNWKCDKSSL